MKMHLKHWLCRSALLISITLALACFIGCETRQGPSAVTRLPVSEEYRDYSLQGGTAPSPSPNGTMPSPIPVSSASNEELWVIARDSSLAGKQSEDGSGTGALRARVHGQEILMPLKHTDVHASVSGFISAVEVSQQFQNPYSSKIEAVYVFPLPHDAAVNEFVMTIGDRRIRGIIRERKEAEQIYQQAKRAGYVASLLTEERPNVFTQSVANIEPGKEIDVNIKYIHTLEYVDGWYEFVFPMVVGPRFNPAGSTNGIGAVARGKSGISGQSTEVHYLAPDERTGHDVALKVDVDAGVNIEEFTCKTHN